MGPEAGLVVEALGADASTQRGEEVAVQMLWRMCGEASRRLTKTLWQNSHMKGFSPVWVRMWTW